MRTMFSKRERRPKLPPEVPGLHTPAYKADLSKIPDGPAVGGDWNPPNRCECSCHVQRN